jgi:type IV pilus assembly protein PilV
MERNLIHDLQGQDTEAGYTLLEVLIAISIFMIGILAIATMQTSALKGNSTSVGFTQALNQGQAWVEQIMAEPYDPTNPSDMLDPADNGTAAHQRTYDSGRNQYTIEWETTAVDLPGGTNPDALDVELTVQWADLYGQHSVNIQFLKTTRF